MLARIRSRLTYANVMASIAVFAALGLGTAWALESNSVKSRHIANDQVRGVDVRDNGLKSEDIEEATLSGVKCSVSSITLQANGASQEVCTDGPLTLKIVCADNGGNPVGRVAVDTAEDNALWINEAAGHSAFADTHGDASLVEATDTTTDGVGSMDISQFGAGTSTGTGSISGVGVVRAENHAGFETDECTFVVNAMT